MAGQHTLNETENEVVSRLGGLHLDYEAMAVTSNLFRAANAVRNHLERTVLAKSDLTWTAFVVLWVVWIWEPIETRGIAAEGGFSKATLSGVLTTLEGRGFLTRERSAADGRLVLVNLTPAGRRLMKKLFPEFNQEECNITRHITTSDLPQAAQILRDLIRATE
ncbi:MAG: MarR family transcriptional regulator [Candidatus Nanopelagicales bacterium]|nr:MarR family transcriptional regulator [Candidatus Nanopelagicales bacterium]PHX60742.1 MAG: MarR family transcriptional regulator [Actinomycetota bacterium]